MSNQPEITEELIERYRLINVDDYNQWYDFTYENWVEKLTDLGYYDVQINFSGFWNQGDGASFTGKVDIKEYLKAGKLSNKFRSVYYWSDIVDLNFVISRGIWRYVHEKSTTVDYSDNYYDTSEKCEAQLEELLEIVREEVYRFNLEIYKELEELYDHLTSDEAVRETLESCDFWYDEVEALEEE